MKIVECVPNFSEGRDRAKVERVVARAREAGVAILDVETDADHHRCVLSFAGAPEACLEACFRVAREAALLIDLNAHKGEHPRMGAVDVIPFIPVRGVSMEDCVRLAERLGERVGRELGIPVFLYDRAARVPERRDLAAVRKGQFEGLRELIGKDPARAPDFGPAAIHPTAGAVAVGAREQIVNFNLNLDTADMAAAKDIARRLRASGGGLPAVRAKEIELAARRQAQVSTVLTDYRRSSLRRVLDEAGRLAAEKGAKVASTEIVGLLPRQALVDFALDTLQPENFQPAVQVLEERLEAALAGAASGDGWRRDAARLAEALGGVDATPGGGSAAAAAGAMGCGLGEMAAGITLKSKGLEEGRRAALESAQKAFRAGRGRLAALAGEDADAFDAFMAAMSLPKADLERPARMQAGLLAAAEAPLRTARAAAEALAEAGRAAALAGPAVASDMACAAHLLRAAALCAAENVRINLPGLKDAAAASRLADELSGVLRGAGLPG